jgi:hypothetical protein
LVTGIHKQLGNPERRGLVVQCSMLTLPWKLAREHRLAPRSATPVGEAAAGELMKAAVQAKGTLRNLPEAMAEPLLPFTLGAGADGKPVGPGPVVHAEALLVGDHEALFSMQIAWPDGAPPAGQKPQAPKPQPQKPRDDGTAFRLQTGAGVLLLGPVARNPGDDEPVTVLWVRFASVVPRAAMKPDGGRAPRRK